MNVASDLVFKFSRGLLGVAGRVNSINQWLFTRMASERLPRPFCFLQPEYIPVRLLHVVARVLLYVAHHLFSFSQARQGVR